MTDFDSDLVLALIGARLGGIFGGYIYGLFPGTDVRATQSKDYQSRSESCVAINPRNQANIVGASKKFVNPNYYWFTVMPIYTFDGGYTWHESPLPMDPEWQGMSDPTVAFDDLGHVFLIGEPLMYHPEKIEPDDIEGLGMRAYRSSDGGRTWEQPIVLHTDTKDDKQWVVCDNHASSPFHGNVYAAWGASSPLRFARSADHGVTWKGKGSESSGSSLVDFSFAPDLCVSPDGSLHIFWHSPGSSSIVYHRSNDGGETFPPPIKALKADHAVEGLTSLHGHLPLTGGYPHFEHGRFRVMTITTSCAGPDRTVVVAWADMREGRSRIYYRRSIDGGQTWLGPEEGSPLLPNVRYGDIHCFHPQIAVTDSGVIGCAFYTFGLVDGRYRIQVQLAGSIDSAATFPWLTTVSDNAWDPLVNAPKSHGNRDVDFIGEYFGLDAGGADFALLWTDTNTGVQELLFDLVGTYKPKPPPRTPEIVGEILFGVSEGGGGLILVGGKLIRIPPRSPLLRVLDAMAELGHVGVEGADAERLDTIANEMTEAVRRRRSSPPQHG